MPLWEGVISAIITPMKDGGEKVDAEAMRSYLDFIVEKGVDGVFVGGTTGEGPLLSLEERKQIAEVAVEKLKGKVKVIVHTGCITTEESIRLTKHSCEIGA
ncbi:MAG TPA: 4-hydroxy-tetrahydrodipicolinate synthase, partial [Candidatus Aerophobetes bacterium]|nr:4-hydroxy-tetrahydrodipicolinate synthase [Candidatus Aerophobetes bacterium]